MVRVNFLLLLLGALVAFSTAESVPTFCKCTCFTNSTIVRLGPKDPSSPPSPGDPASLKGQSATRMFLRSLNPFTDLDATSTIAKRAASSSCAQCTRAFCLSYNLPICKDAEEKDVVTMCFQRDSRKDMIIVWGFILGTAGLLGWAALKRAVEFKEAKTAATRARMGLRADPAGEGLPRDRGVYAPVGSVR